MSDYRIGKIIFSHRIPSVNPIFIRREATIPRLFGAWHLFMLIDVPLALPSERQPPSSRNQNAA